MSNAMTTTVPDYLKNAGPAKGAEELGNFIRPSRIKIIQPTATKEWAEQFQAGDVVLSPQRQKIAALKGTFHFVPLFFYADWICWNPLETRGTLPGMREHSLDSKSALAKMCRNFKENSSVPCPEMPKAQDGKPLYLRYLEHLNFIISVTDPAGLENTLVVLSYSGGEHRYGSNFCSLLKARGVDIFACQFAGTCRRRDGKKGTWFGVDGENPSALPAFVDEEAYKRNEILHSELAKALEDRRLVVDREDEEFVENAENSTF